MKEDWPLWALSLLVGAAFLHFWQDWLKTRHWRAIYRRPEAWRVEWYTIIARHIEAASPGGLAYDKEKRELFWLYFPPRLPEPEFKGAGWGKKLIPEKVVRRQEANHAPSAHLD